LIPKIIHYCWFGKGKMPELALQCIESWEKYLPDYQLRLWNEDTFDITSHPYVLEAYQAKKYAFVTDYIRLYALYHFGGVYMDTDVEVIRNLDELLYLPGFSGFESEKDVPTGILACESHNPWAKEQLAYYRDRHFNRPEGKPDLTSNVEIISTIMHSNGFLLNNHYQVYKDCMHMFPKDYFCPKSRSGIITLTPNTYCIHHFAASWLPWNLRLKKLIFRKLVGPEVTDLLIRTKRKLKNWIKNICE